MGGQHGLPTVSNRFEERMSGNWKFFQAFSLLLLLFASNGGFVMSESPTDKKVGDRHQWGRFRAGAWKRVRIHSETFDEKGSLANSSVTETYTVLTNVTDSTYDLRVEVTVDVGGRKFTAQPQIIRQGYFGEADGQKVTVSKASDGNLEISGIVVPSKVNEVTINGGPTKRVMTIHSSERLPFFALKRDCKATDADGKTVHYTTAVDVLAVDMPHRVLDEIHETAFVKTVHKQGKNTTLTIELDCPDVPGGVVAHSLREEDDKGRLLRRSTLELVGYGTSSDADGGEDPTPAARRRIFRNRTRTSSERRPGTD